MAELGVSRSTVYRLIRAGELGRVHVRSSARITRNSMKRFVSRQIEIGRITGGQL